jgi:hypothetical protein
MPGKDEFNAVVLFFVRELAKGSNGENVIKFLQAVEQGRLQAARLDFELYHDADQTINCFLLDMLD